ncbi:MAG: NfeD family protein [Kiritimatiellae bacterium]|nr:NfeD family protein [Kiritimatiellia bacterium]
MSVFYSWLVAGLVMCALEFVVPGFIIIFFGAGAVLTAFATLLFPEMGANAQALLFLALSIVSLVIFRRHAIGHGAKKNADAAVDYDDDFIGREVVAVEALEPGKPGKVELNGVQWNAVASEALAPGDRAKVRGRNGLVLEIAR